MSTLNATYNAFDFSNARPIMSMGGGLPSGNDTVFTLEGGHKLPLRTFYWQQVMANNVIVAALTLYAWEYLSTLPSEIYLYRTRKWTSPHVILFAMIRYGTIPALVLPAYSIWHDFRNDSDGCPPHPPLVVCFVQLIVAIILAQRTIGIWTHNRFIIAIFAVLVPLQFTASFMLLWVTKEIILPNGACMALREHVDTMPWFYLTAMIYDLIAISLSSWKLWQYGDLGFATLHSDLPSHEAISQERSASTIPKALKHVKSRWQTLTPLIDSLLRSGLVYVAVAMAFNITNFAMLYSQQLHAHAFLVLYAPLMCILMQRIILTDVDAIWGKQRRNKRGGTGEREQDLIDRVVQDARHSWEASIDLRGEQSTQEKERRDIKKADLSVMALCDCSCQHCACRKNCTQGIS